MKPKSILLCYARGFGGQATQSARGVRRQRPLEFFFSFRFIYCFLFIYLVGTMETLNNAKESCVTTHNETMKIKKNP